MLKIRARGDTLIEVLLAFGIFSLAAVMSFVLFNQGMSMAQRSLEKSLVRQQIDSQAEILRYAATTSDPVWRDIVTNYIATTAMPFSRASCPKPSDLDSAKSFFVTKNGTSLKVNAISAASNNFLESPTYARVDYAAMPAKAYGMWVRVVKAENKTIQASLDAYDFYIHACWNSVGLDVPMTAGTIVRIYARS